ncbi:P-loop containing nucleoside triphosphate hydrolase protein [Atractiella rhizophila]|nr:P-loop containing nucleoside triphosphate hydrolase protein [Atractiella rhizophila]
MSLKQELEIHVKALEAYDAQDFETALELFEQIADSSKILFNIALIHATLGNHEVAVENYNAANALDQYLAVSYFQCGVSNFLLGRYEEARRDFDDAYLYLRGNLTIDYEQLGLKFRLYSCEVLFNKGLSLIYMGNEASGMEDFQEARKEKQTPEHNVIDEALGDRGDGYTVFSIPVGVLYRPPSSKVNNLKQKNYLGQAKLVAASDARDAFVGFTGAQRAGKLPPGPAAMTPAPAEPKAELSRSKTTMARIEGADDGDRGLATLRRRPTEGGAATGLQRAATTIRPVERSNTMPLNTNRPAPPPPNPTPSQQGTNGRPNTEFVDDLLAGYAAEDEPVPPIPQGQPKERVADWAAKNGRSNNPLPSPPRSTTDVGLARRATSSRAGTAPRGYGGNALSVKRAPSSRRRMDDYEEEGYGSEYEDGMTVISTVKEMRKIRSISPELALDDFIDRLKAKFDLGRFPSMKFKDEDGTLVTIKDDDDWESAIDEARANAKGREEEGETAEEKAKRLQEALDKKQRSDRIDLWLQQEARDRKRANKKKGVIQILLLGPENAGKSTFLKQIRLAFDPLRLQHEREVYRIVVYLSLISAIRKLLELVEQNYRSLPTPGGSYLSSRSRPPPVAPTGRPYSKTFSVSSTRDQSANNVLLSKLRLAPVLALEEKLRQKLGTTTAGQIALPGRSLLREDDYYEQALLSAKVPLRMPSLLRGNKESDQSNPPVTVTQSSSTLFVYPHKWKALSSTPSLPKSQSSVETLASSRSKSLDSSFGGDDEDVTFFTTRSFLDLEDPSRLLNECKYDIRALIDEAKSMGIWDKGSMENNDKYYLDSVDRVVDPSYNAASDEDMLVSRVKTLGVDEHFVDIEDRQFHICDISGTFSRSSRPVWASHFSNADAIVFVADLSVYDSPLPSDPKVNRLRDAIERFGELCKNQILANASIILFLNKIDLLKEKISDPRRQVKLFFPEFEAANPVDAVDPEFVARFFSHKFRRRAESPRNSRIRRLGWELKVYFTTCTNSSQMKGVISSVRDIIVTKRLEDASILV